MRSLILVIALLISAGSLRASDADLWNQYNSLKSNQFSSLTLSAQNELDMANVAEQLGRADIAAWKYNNAGYDLIQQFMAVTNYHEATAAIEKASGADRKAKRVAFREVLLSNKALLDQAHGYLAQAVAIDSDSVLKEKASSNLGFIRWVKSFIAKKN